jgi:hypothetical protein
MRMLTAEQVADVVFRLRDENLARHAFATLAASMAYRGRQLVATFSRSPQPPHPLALSEALNDLRSVGMQMGQVNTIKALLQSTITDVYARCAQGDSDEPPFECSDDEYIGLISCADVSTRTWEGVRPIYLQFQSNLAGEADLLTVAYVNGETAENNVFPAPK